MNPITDKKKDPELRKAARAFIKAFNAAVASSDEEATRILSKPGWMHFEGGIAEFTDELISALSGFVERATKLLGSKGAHEKAIRQLATKEAQRAFTERKALEEASAHLIDRVFEEGAAEFEFLVPNYLMVFENPVRSIVIGRVRAALTEDLAAELRQRSNDRIKVVPAKTFSIKLGANPPSALVQMHDIAWLVSVSAANENVEEEAKWMIDVAVSFLRLHIKTAGSRFPEIGTIEPHPLRRKPMDNIGVKFRGTTAHVGGRQIPRVYEIDADLQAISSTDQFQARAKLIFDPPNKSVAARVSQGLGWLTRGRQAEDRAERLLYFFTAIESILSMDDKTAPVVQTIARHAAVLLTNEIDQRVSLSTEIKRLYGLRSTLVHSGNRGVLWNAANLAQYLAEGMFLQVFRAADLGASYASLCEELAIASFGSPWPAPKPAGGGGGAPG